jgi:hypothetical protein
MKICFNLNKIGISYRLLTMATAFICIGALELSLRPSAAAAPGFDPGGRLTDGRSSHTATLLTDGRILVAGGFQINGRRLIGLQTAELYDPATRTWSTTGSLAQGRANHTATLLPNGMVLVAGGLTGDLDKLDSAELYDPSTGLWTSTGNLLQVRESATATLLPSGQVLLAGGEGDGEPALVAELYDPATDVWSATGSLNTGHVEATATLLPNGLVLLAAGLTQAAELYNPATGLWTFTGNLITARNNHTDKSFA